MEPLTLGPQKQKEKTNEAIVARLWQGKKAEAQELLAPVYSLTRRT
jgi:hypothetical protein